MLSNFTSNQLNNHKICLVGYVLPEGCGLISWPRKQKLKLLKKKTNEIKNHVNIKTVG